MSEARQPLGSVVVVGSGQVGVLAAIAIKRALPPCEVTIVGHKARPCDFADHAASALPFTNRLHARLGIPEAALLATAGGSHRLVERYFDWGGTGQNGSLAYGDISKQGAADFGRQWGGGSRSAEAERPPGTLAEVLANAGRFRTVGDSQDSPLSRVEYAMRWNPPAYLALLIEHARRLGINYLDAPISAVTMSESGEVTSIQTAIGEDLEAELLLDCSGSARALVSRVSSEAFREHGSPARRIVYAKPGQPMLALEDRLSLTAHGWLREFAGRDGLQQMLGLAESADAEMACQTLGIEPVTQIAVSSGTLENCWTGNVVALGDAAAEFEPLANYHLDLAHRMIGLLIEMLPGARIEPAERAEFNRRAGLMIEGTQEIIGLHYRAPAARKLFSAGAGKGRVEKTVDQFSRRGRLPFIDEQPLTGFEKQSLMRALGFQEGVPPQFRASSRTENQIAERHLAQVAKATLADAPPYAQWLSSILRN